MAYRGNSRGAYGGAAYDQYMEGENDALVNSLASKVTQLKDLSNAIHIDMKDQNNMLNDINGGFDSAGSLLGGTMKRLTALTKGGGSCTMMYLAMFVFFVFLLLWRLTR